jgi:hypothetical protein
MKPAVRLTLALALYAAPLAAQQQVSGVNWTVTIMPSMNPVPVGSCGAVSMTLRDSTGKDAPRTPEGWRVSIADFDMTVSSATNVVGVYNGASNWSVCACQGATAEKAATITATYPAKMLAAKSRVVGVEGQWAVPVSIVTSKSTFNPAGCGTTTTAATTSPLMAPVTGTTLLIAPTATLASVPGAVTGIGVGAVSSNVQATMVIDGIPFSVKQRSGGSTVLGISAANGTITRLAKSYEPIVVDVPLGTPMDAWISQGWQGTVSPKSGSISQLDARVPMTQLTFSNATILSTTIPTLDAGSTDAAYLRVALSPATTGEAAGVASPPSTASKAWSGSKFALTIPGVTTTDVSRIESFVVGRSPAVDAATGEVSYKTSPGASVVPKLLVTLKEASAADWVAWLNASVTGSSTTEKTLTLDLRSASDVHLATIQGDGVGIIALRSVNSGGDFSRRVQAELYVKRLQLLP